MEYYEATLCYLNLFTLLTQRYQKELKEYLITRNRDDALPGDTAGTDMPDLMDIDGALLSMKRDREKPLPKDPWDKTVLHIRMIEHYVDADLEEAER